MKGLISFVLLLVLATFVVEATHFRYGTISWEPVSNRTVNFKVILSFRKTYFSSSSIYTNAQVSHSTFYYGDGSSKSLTMTVTDINTDEDWFIGRSEFSYTYKSDKNYTAYYKDCCRISTLENNADADWYISTSVLIMQKDGIINTPPVAGFAPIVTVTAGIANYFQITAYDKENQPLTYSLSNIWSTSSSTLYHPSGLSLSGNNITFTPGPVDNNKDYELYCTQIVISDGISYIVVDFIFKAIRPITGVCDPSCSNNGASCGSDSSCTNCLATVTKKCDTKQPPYFMGDTPAQGSVKTFNIAANNKFTFQAQSPYPRLSVSIQVSNTPLGSIAQPVIGTNPTNNTYTWTPKIENIGSYVVSASTQDSDGTPASEGIRSFVIIVSKPLCGHSTSTTPAGACICEPGWSEASNCYDCATGYYGSDCKTSTNCNGNGDSNDGITGDGLCRCYLGWEGDNCNISVSQFCDAGASSKVTGATYEKGFLASSLTTLLSTYSSASALTIPLNLTKPTATPYLNILTVFDVAPKTQAIWDNIKSEISDFENQVENTISETSEFALGYFSDSSSNSNTYQPTVLGMGSPIADGVKNLTTTVTSNSNGNSILALKAAASSTVAWKAGAFKIVLLFTDSDFTDTSNQAATLQALIDQSIFPIVISYGGGAIPNWISFFNSNFGVAISSKAGSSWKTNAISAIQQSFTKAYPYITSASDSVFVVTPLPSAVTVSASGSYSINYQLKYPANAQSVVLRPKVYLSVIGYGKTSVLINYNHAPVPQPSQFTTQEDTSSIVNFVVTDIDSNLISIAFPSFSKISTLGQIQYNGSPVVAGSFYPMKDSVFTFVPYLNQNTGSTPITIDYTANDGCIQAGSTLTITVQPVNDPATCINVSPSLSTDVNTQVSFNLFGKDADSDVTVTLVTSGVNSLLSRGSLKTSGSTAQSGFEYPNNTAFTYIQTDNSYTGSITLEFKVADNQGTSQTCSVTIGLVHLNVAPTIASASKIITNPTIQGKLSVSITDPDTPSTGNLYIQSQTQQFTSCVSPFGSLVTGSPIPYSIVSGQASVSLCITPPNMAAQAGWATIKLYANDSDSAKSNVVTVVVDVVGTRPNSQPIVNQIPNFSFTQGNSAPAVVISGSDPNQPEFDNNLIASITTPPTNGKFVLVNGNSATATSSAPYSIVYVENSGFWGTDQFSYAVIDELGAQSDIKTTQITVNYKPSAPILNIPTLTFNQFTSVPLQSLSVTDVDIAKKSDVVTCSITSLPTRSIIKDQNNNTISSTPFQLNSQYQYYISAPAKTYESYTDSFKAQCTDTFQLSSPITTGQIVFNYINQAPTAESSTVETDQNVPVSFTFNVNDLEKPNTISVKLLTVPVNGEIKCNDKVAVANVEIKTISCIYTPNRDQSDYDTTGHIGPLDTISFVAIDAAGDSSVNTASVQFYVTPKNPPVYLGNDRVSSLEDATLPVLILGRPGDGGSSYGVTINNIVGNGTLSKQYCMGPESCISKPITTFPYDSEGADVYDYTFNPVPNEFHDDYMIIYFVLFEKTEDGILLSEELTITIDVTPVNDPPTIQLISSQVIGTDVIKSIPDSGYVSIPVNSSVILTYTGLDIDSDASKLDSVILAPPAPARGILYRYNESAEGFLGTQITRSSNVVDRDQSSQNWKVVYVPRRGSSGTGYAKIPISIRDDELALSGSSIISIDVDPINLPPFITAKTTVFSVLTGNSVQISDVTFDDPDSTYNNVSLKVSVLNSEDQSPVADADIILHGDYKSSCTLSNGVLSCVGTKTLLNSYLTSITLNQTTGKYLIRVFVDDLGYAAAPAQRDESHLTATQDLELTVTSPEASIKKTSNKTVLSAAIAGAAVAAGVIAAGVWKLVKKAAPPTGAFFGDNPFADGAVSSNPLYAESENSGMNPLYEAGNEA